MREATVSHACVLSPRSGHIQMLLRIKNRAKRPKSERYPSFRLPIWSCPSGPLFPHPGSAPEPGKPGGPSTPSGPSLQPPEVRASPPISPASLCRQKQFSLHISSPSELSRPQRRDLLSGSPVESSPVPYCPHDSSSGSETDPMLQFRGQLEPG